MKYWDNNMKKSIFAAVALAAGVFASGAASATTFDLTSVLLASGSTNIGNSFVATSPTSLTAFDDTYLFSVPQLNTGDPEGTYTLGITKRLTNINISDISFFQIVNGQHVAVDSSFGDGQFFPLNDVAAGSYGFEIVGKTKIAGVTGSYGGTMSLTLTPVPEPETYGMLLVGLGLLGFTARRKSNPKLG